MRKKSEKVEKQKNVEKNIYTISVVLNRNYKKGKIKRKVKENIYINPKKYKRKKILILYQRVYRRNYKSIGTKKQEKNRKDHKHKKKKRKKILVLYQREHTETI